MGEGVSTKEVVTYITDSVSPFVPSLPGSGRTVFLKSYLYLVRNLGEGAIICNGFRDLKQTFLENLYQSSLLYVDLKKLQPREPWKRDFHWAVYYAIIEAACSKASIPMLSIREGRATFSCLYVIL